MSSLPPFQTVVLLSLGILLPGSVQADTVTFISTTGADFQNCCGSVQGLSNGILVGGYSDSGSRFLFSNPLAPTFYMLDGGHESVVTGPLVAQTDTSWTFEGGNVLADSDAGVAAFPLPTGYATCEADGFQSWDFPGYCLTDDELVGTLNGDVVLSLSNVQPEPSGGFSAYFDLAGPMTFGIPGDFARAAGVAAGPYIGSLDIQGFYMQYVALDGQTDYFINYDFFEVSGVSVPEPSTFLFLLTAFAFTFVHLWRRGC